MVVCGGNKIISVKLRLSRLLDKGTIFTFEGIKKPDPPISESVILLIVPKMAKRGSLPLCTLAFVLETSSLQVWMLKDTYRSIMLSSLWLQSTCVEVSLPRERRG